MDDPWGSPWNSARIAPYDSTAVARAPSPAKSDLEPPRPAVLTRSGSPRPETASAQSPWADDNDSYGDWVAGSTPLPTGSSTLVWGGWGGQDATGSNNHRSSRSRDDPSLRPASGSRNGSLGTPSPIAWPESIARSPRGKLAASPSFRSASPDPWATDLSVEQLARITPASTPRLVVDEPAISPLHGIATPVRDDDLSSIWLQQRGGVKDNSTELGLGPVTSQIQTPEEPKPHAEEFLEDNHPAALSGLNSAPTKASHSRESSLSGEDSDRDVDRQDSPITSVDDDSRLRPPTRTRKPSGKVYELVHKFDDLAKAAVLPPSLLTRSSREDAPGEETSEAKDEANSAADFGDFENAEAEAHSSIAHAPSSLTEDCVQLEEQLGDIEPPDTPRSVLAGCGRLPPATNSHIEAIVAKFGLLKFKAETSKIDDLFAYQTDPLPSHDRADQYVPDTIIHDSFIQISERKSWYRVSRQGSSRKHDAGDDDSYRLVTWQSSTLRTDVLKVVRRWMEEDSMTGGRSTLGVGLGRSGNIFGWGDETDSVSLGDVFAKKKPAEAITTLQSPEQSSSAPPSQALPEIRDVTSQAQAETKSRIEIPPPPAAFSWNNGSNEDPMAWSSDPPSNVTTREAASIAVQPTVVLSPEMSNGLAVVPSKKPTTPSSEDDDDAWGEMIASPDPSSQPAFSSTALGGLNDLFLPQVQFPSHPGILAACQTTDPDQDLLTLQDVSRLPVQDQAKHGLDGSSWPGVDFSLFDSPAEPMAASTGLAVYQPTANRKPAMTIEDSAPDSSNSAKLIPCAQPSSCTITASSTAAAAGPSSMTIPSILENRPDGKPRDERTNKDDQTVRQIIDGLPDLSYMLR